MAVSTDVPNENELTHTEKVAKQHPEAVKAVADRSGEHLSAYLERVLSNVEE